MTEGAVETAPERASDGLEALAERPHRRRNPLSGEWVLVSPHRTARPWQGQLERPAVAEEVNLVAMLVHRGQIGNGDRPGAVHAACVDCRRGRRARC